MKSFFVGQSIPNELFHSNYKACKGLTDGAANVFYNAVLTGLAGNGVEVTAQSSLPAHIIPQAKKSYGGVQYRYSLYKSNTIQRLLDNAFRSYYDVIKWSEGTDKSDSFVLFNMLRIGKSMGALLACKIKGLKTVAIVTDVPGHRIERKRFSLADYIGQKLLYQFDRYVLLSDAMREIVCVSEEKVAIIEGFFDPQTIEGIIPCTDKNTEVFTVMYAGSLHYKYGIMELVKAIQTLETSRVQLKVYGVGEAAEEISEISRKDARICYCGQVSHKEILQEEANADLLVNPRPVDEEYVKYSFPSKNMEYMASGTPVLMTDIPSLPKEYREYLTIVPSNDHKVMAEAIEQIMTKERTNQNEDILLKASAGRQFVLGCKNCTEQTRKIIKVIMECKTV